jgi:magnesium transporter
MIRRYTITDGKLQENGAEDAPVLVFASPTDEEKKQLVEVFRIDEHTLASALDPDELGRLEFEEDHVAIIFKRPKNYSSADNFLFKVWSYGLFIFPKRVVVVRNEDLPVFDARHFARLKTPLDVGLRLLSRTINHFIDHIKGINLIAGELEQKISASMENRYLLNMFTIEKSLVYYLYGINSNGVVIDKLKSNASKIGFTPENVEYLDDLIIENNQCYRQAEVLSGILSSLMDARASIVSNNLNWTIRRLTLISTIFLPLSFLAGVGGMSEWSMITGPNRWYIAYPVFMVLMGGIGVAIYYFLRRLEERDRKAK